MHEFPSVKCIEDIEAIEATDWKKLCPHKSTFDLIRHAAAKYADNDALVFLPRGNAEEDAHTVTYRELFSRITQAANLFYDLGVSGHDVVSYTLPNLPETHEIIWGAEAAGIVNAVNPFLESGTVSKLLKAAETKVLVTSAPIPGLDLWEPILEAADKVESIKFVLVVDPMHRYMDEPAIELPERTPGGKLILSYEKAIAHRPKGYLAFDRQVDRNSVASLFHTGGTTGVPKLAPHTHENEVFTAWIMTEIFNTQPGDRPIVGLPLFHVNAVIATGLAAIAGGASCVMVSPLGYRGENVVANIWAIVERYRATSISGVPTIYSALMSVPKQGYDLSSLRYAAVGAAPLSPELFKSFVGYSGVELVEGYGLTECTVAASANPLEGEKKVGSIGLRIPFQDMRCAVLDESGEISRFCKVNEVGVIVLKGPNVFPGYYKREESGLTSDGWLNTGDLGREDEDGYFWLTGRAKDLIIRGGHNIDPGMIENTLEEHEAVALAAAVGQPDSYAGELPVAYVQLQPNKHISSSDLKSWAKSKIPERAAAPVYVEIMQSIPVTAVGKIHKPPLRMKATKRVVNKILDDNGLAAHVDVADRPGKGLVVKIKSNSESDVRQVLGELAINIEISPFPH